MKIQSCFQRPKNTLYKYLFRLHWSKKRGPVYMICDFCLMDRIVLLKLPVTLLVEDEPIKVLEWGKARAICTMCIDIEGVLNE